MPAGSCRFPFTLVSALVATCLLGSCRGSEPIPRIEPTLYNWHEHYRSAETLRVHVFDTGSIRLPAAFVYQGGGWFAGRKLEAPAFVIEHPSRGMVVFDTGLSVAIREEPSRYLGAMWASLVPIETPERRDLASQMRAAGMAPESVSYVVLSDMHFDHAGEVEAFPNAQVVVARTERQAALDAKWYDAYLPADYDEVPRWLEIDYQQGEPFGTFTAHHDLLGDGSVVLVDLHGHSPGTQGVVIRTESGPVLIVGDAAALDESWRYASRPAYAYDRQAWWEQVWRIKKFADLVPSATVIPGHDLTGLARSGNPAIVVHDPERLFGDDAVGRER